MKKTKRWDYKILFSIQKIQNSFLNSFMLYCTRIGNGGIIWILFGILYLLNPIYRSGGVILLLNLAICAFIVNLLIKPVFTRKRPFETFNHIKVLIKPPFGTSFPSGHTATSFASAFTIIYLDLPLKWLACFLAICISISRIYLFVHYPTDVIGGAIIGILISIFIVPIAMNIII